MGRPVARVERLPSREEFERDFMKPALPAVFAIPPCGALGWTLDGLRDRVGEAEIISRIHTASHEYKV